MIIRYESELVAHFREFAHDDPNLHLAFRPEKPTPTSARSDFLELELDGNRFAFCAFYELKPSLS